MVNCDGCGSQYPKHLPSLFPRRTTPPQGHLSSTLACSKTDSCPTPISVVILHLDNLCLHIPFSMLIFYRFLDLWFAIMDWSQAGNGNITFQRPTATCVGLPEGLYLHRITEAELRKHTLNSLIYTRINICPPSHTSLRLRSSSCGASTSGRCLLRATISQMDDVGLPVLLPATASHMHFFFLLLLLSYPVWYVVSSLHPLSVGCCSSSVKGCFPCPVRVCTLEKSSLRSSRWIQVFSVSTLIWSPYS